MPQCQILQSLLEGHPLNVSFYLIVVIACCDRAPPQDHINILFDLTMPCMVEVRVDLEGRLCPQNLCSIDFPCRLIVKFYDIACAVSESDQQSQRLVFRY